jgi:hypothetical protein
MEMWVDHCRPMKIQKNLSFILSFLGGFIIFGGLGMQLPRK